MPTLVAMACTEVLGQGVCAWGWVAGNWSARPDAEARPAGAADLYGPGLDLCQWRAEAGVLTAGDRTLNCVKVCPWATCPP